MEDEGGELSEGERWRRARGMVNREGVKARGMDGWRRYGGERLKENVA